MQPDDYFAANQKLWDARTGLHLESEFYDLAAWKAGKSSLCGIEVDEMGPVDGRSLLHLQCHFGMDSLSLARLGADVTAVDFSEEAIRQAQSLSDELAIPAKFLCHNVLELPDHLDQTFDIVFSSFGVLGWLPDVNRWAKIVRHFLRPNGFLYLLEFHPQFSQLNHDGQITFDYFHRETPDREIATVTYADAASHPPLEEYWWNHTISDVYMAISQAGMRLERMCEYPYSAYQLNDQMVETEPGRWVHEQLGDKIPYMMSWKASGGSVRP